jgi:hypothetical protein
MFLNSHPPEQVVMMRAHGQADAREEEMISGSLLRATN